MDNEKAIMKKTILSINLFLIATSWSQSNDPLRSYQNNTITLTQELTREVIVAVIDTGIDINHPDLQANIFRNDIECDNGKPQTDKVEDRDRNGYPGDCFGWNFVPNESPVETKPEDIPNSETLQIPEDREGHGTHVSGIISASQNNGIGITGSSNKIKILPLKVFQKTFQPRSQFRLKFENKVSNANRTNILIQAVDYAIKRNVDIINFSIGWNKNIDSPLLRLKISEAQKKGIIIVAAAGNDAAEVTTFPCLYENVICVGASSLTNQILDTSNFGNAVDFFAPGEKVLSTFPQNAIVNNFLPGYDYYSGTSQAAPYTSKVLALLKGLAPEKLSHDFLKLLYQTRTPILPSLNNTSSSNSGILNPVSAINTMSKATTSSNYVVPSFKTLLQKPLDSEKSILLSIPVKIFANTDNASTFHFSLKPFSEKITITNPILEISTKENFKQEYIEFKIQFSDLSIDQKQFFTLNISDNQNLKIQYTFSTRFFRTDLTPNTILPFEFTTTQPYLSQRGNGKGTPLVNITNLYGDATNFFFVEFFEKKEDATVLRLTLHELQNEKFKELAVNTFPNVIRTIGFKPIDLNFDGISEYLLTTEAIEKVETLNNSNEKVLENKRYVKIYYLNHDLKPVYSDVPFIRYDLIFPVITDKQRYPLYPLGNISVIPVNVEGKFLPQIVSFQESAVLENYNKIKNRFISQNGTGPEIFFFTPHLENQKAIFKVHSLSGDLLTKKWTTLIPKKEPYRISGYVSLCKTCKNMELAVVYNKGELGFLRYIVGDTFSNKNVVVDINSFTKKYDYISQTLLGVLTYPNKKIYIRNFNNDTQWSATLPHKGPWRALYLKYLTNFNQYHIVLGDSSQLLQIKKTESNYPTVQSVNFDKYFGTSWSSTGDLFDVTKDSALLDGTKLSDIGLSIIPFAGDNLALTVAHSLNLKANCLPLGLFQTMGANSANFYQLCQDKLSDFFIERY